MSGADAIDPTRVVADADVLVADLLVGGAARSALDYLREHSWLTLVASDPLLEEAEATIATLADDALAADWRERMAAWREPVDHPAGDHPALASAYRGDAAHLLTYDDSLSTTQANLSVKPHVALSIRPPDAFATLFDAASLYEVTHDDPYPGSDRDPRA
jgi:predicted nucleic acid-binding protein